MSHGHSHGGHGHSHGGHGHSHGGAEVDTVKKGMKTFFDREIGLDDDFDDDPALDKQWRGRNKAADEGSLDPNQEFELLCAHGALAAVMVQWAAGTDVDRRNQYQGVDATPIMWASLRGHLPVVKFLFHHGAKINYQMPDGQNALMWAATECRLEVGSFLLKNGADPALLDERNYSAAMIAVQNDDLPFLHLINSYKKVDPEQVDFEGHTLLIWAAYRGQLAMVEYVHEVLGVDPKHLDKDKRHALHWAAREGHAEVSAYLIKCGLSPHDLDIEGRDALSYAVERNHGEVASILKSQATEITDRAVGTLSKMASHRAFLIQSLFGVIVIICGFIMTLWLPPFFSHFIFGAFLGKNLLYRFVYPRPVTSRKAAGGMLAEIGAPKNLAQAMRGLGFTRLREPMNLFGLLTFFIVQHISFDLGGVTFPPLYWVFTVLILVSMLIAKQFAYGSQVLQRGSLKDSPVLTAVERKEWHTINDRIFDVSRHTRVPLRTFYCQEIDANVRRYDGWSLFLDAPIGESNHRSFFFFVVFATIHQIWIFGHAWAHFSEKVCPANHHEHGFSLCGTLYSFIFHALPCNDIAPNAAELGWVEWMFPSKNNTAGVWLIHFGFVAAVGFFSVLLRQLSAISQGLTRKELVNPLAPTTNGSLVSVMRGNRTNIYSEGGPTANLMLFIFGKQGERWKDLYAVPAPPTS